MPERGQILVLTGGRPAERWRRYTTLYLYRLSFAKTIGPGRSAITMTPAVRRVDTPDPGYSSRLGAAAAWRGSYVAPRQCVPIGLIQQPGDDPRPQRPQGRRQGRQRQADGRCGGQQQSIAAMCPDRHRKASQRQAIGERGHQQAPAGPRLVHQPPVSWPTDRGGEQVSSPGSSRHRVRPGRTAHRQHDRKAGARLAEPPDQPAGHERRACRANAIRANGCRAATRTTGRLITALTWLTSHGWHFNRTATPCPPTVAPGTGSRSCANPRHRPCRPWSFRCGSSPDTEPEQLLAVLAIQPSCRIVVVAGGDLGDQAYLVRAGACSAVIP